MSTIAPRLNGGQAAALEAPTGGLLIVGGYGVVGSRTAHLLRARHPRLRLVLGGRDPARASRLLDVLDAQPLRLDVASSDPLAGLREPPAAILAAVSDPYGRLLDAAVRRGIPYADINRAGQVPVLAACARATGSDAAAPVLLCGSWLSGLTALLAAALTGLLGETERIEITVWVSSRDRIGPDAWGFSRRLAWPMGYADGGLWRTTHPLADVRLRQCPDGRRRPAARVGTLEQLTLPVTLGVPTVETRIALDVPAELWGLVALKRTGVLRLLDRPSLAGVRARLLQRGGPGDMAGCVVQASGPRGRAGIELLDVRGQAHLNALGAAGAAERILGLAGAALRAGVGFPEQYATPVADLAALRRAGVHVRRTGAAARDADLERDDRRARPPTLTRTAGGDQR